MKEIFQWIDVIIEDLVDPTKNLKDILLKVQVLAFKLKNDRLKGWIDNELNGYVGKELPEYRRIPSAVFGNIIQSRGFGGHLIRRNTPLPVEYLNAEIRTHLAVVNMASKVAEIEKMIRDEGDYQINIPHFIHLEITKKLANGWHVDTAWQKISLNSLEGVLSSVRSNLLNFLLELNQEVGDNDNFSIMERKKDVEKVFNKTIGAITGDTINVSIGDQSMQAINLGNEGKMNVARGTAIDQSFSEGLKIELGAFVKEIKSKIDELNFDREAKAEVLNELARVETQIAKNAPKREIVSSALKVVYDIMIGVTTNAYTPIIIEQLTSLMSRL